MKPAMAFQSAPSLLIAYLIPIGLWGLLWLSIAPGSITALFLLLGITPGSITVFNTDNPNSLLQELRAGLPFAAICLAMVIMLAKLKRQKSRRFHFFGPLGFSLAYGLIGLGAGLLSPDVSQASYWAGSYLSVPLVLWAIVWGPSPLDQIGRIITANWALMVFASMFLYVVALIYLDLNDVVQNPPALLTCESIGSWFKFTSGVLRSTGVGRIAAITAIVAFSFLLAGKWRIPCLAIFIVALSLLMTTGARTSLVGLAVTVPVIGLFLGGRKTIILGTLVIFVFGGAIWSSGLQDDILHGCLLKGWDAEGISYLKMRSPEPRKAVELPPESGQEHVASLAVTASNDRTLSGAQRDGQVIGIEPIKIEAISDGMTLQKFETRLQDESGPTDTLTLTGGESIPRKFVADELSPTRPQASRNSEPTQTPSGVVIVASTSSTPVDSPETLTAPTHSPTLTIPNSSWSLERVPTAMPKGATDISSPETTGLHRQPNQPNSTAAADNPVSKSPNPSFIPTGFFTFSGRTVVWATGWEFIKQSIWLGYGFHADRIVLGTHIHNSFMHAMMQTGLIGTLPFTVAVFYGWFLMGKTVFNFERIPVAERQLVITAVGVLVFLSIRGVFESTGAFFGIDWLLAAPLLLYLQILHSNQYHADEAN